MLHDFFCGENEKKKQKKKISHLLFRPLTERDFLVTTLNEVREFFRGGAFETLDEFQKRKNSVFAYPKTGPILKIN